MKANSGAPIHAGFGGLQAAKRLDTAPATSRSSIDAIPISSSHSPIRWQMLATDDREEWSCKVSRRPLRPELARAARCESPHPRIVQAECPIHDTAAPPFTRKEASDLPALVQQRALSEP
jgi:hypothetical protein